jgi:phospholipid/cholesterol/gamma-HCH transport system ATP-binding protein
VVASGTPEELNRSDLEVVKQFMKGLPDVPVAFHYPAPDYEKELLGP